MKKIIAALVCIEIAVLFVVVLASIALYMQTALAGENKIEYQTDSDKTDQPENINNPQLRAPTAEEKQTYPLSTNLPALYITVGGSMSKITKEKYVAGKYTLVCGEEEGIYDALLTIKGRGNYSWSNPKKPYNIKLNKPMGLLGMKSARKWVLLGDYVDKTLLRSYMTFTLMREISGDFNPDCRYVDVFFNGKYNGTYLLLEAIQIHENRVDIDEETEAIFEIEATYRHEGHENCVKMSLSGDHHIMYKRPGEKDIYPDVRAANLEKFKTFFMELEASFTKGYNSYCEYIDVDSFIDWYIVNEFVKNYDSGFTSSCYCYIKDGKLHMGPIWDYHTCYGNQDVATGLNPKGYHVQTTSPWYSVLCRDETFAGLLRERWTQLVDDGVFDGFVKTIFSTAEYISASADKNFKIWPDAMKDKSLRGKPAKYTYDEELDYMVKWCMERINWLNGEWYIK